VLEMPHSRTNPWPTMVPQLSDGISAATAATLWFSITAQARS
jgi:hypothetical protein